MLVESESQACQQGLEGKIEAPKPAWRVKRTGCQPRMAGPDRSRGGWKGPPGQRGQITSGATNPSRGQGGGLRGGQESQASQREDPEFRDLGPWPRVEVLNPNHRTMQPFSLGPKPYAAQAIRGFWVFWGFQGFLGFFRVFRVFWVFKGF